MSYQLAKILKSYIATSASKIREVHQPESEPDIDACMVMTYEVAARFVSQTFGIKPPRKYVKQSGLSAAQDLLRLEDDNWWFGRLVRTRKIMREHLAMPWGKSLTVPRRMRLGIAFASTKPSKTQLGCDPKHVAA